LANYIMAFDFGTSGLKTVLFSETGELVRSCTRSYEVEYSHGNWAEEDPYEWWAAVKDTTKVVLEGVNPADVAVVSLSAHTSGSLFLDKDGEPVRHHIMWNDGRCGEENEYIRSKVTDVQAYFDEVGYLPGGGALARLMWVRKNEPENFKRIYKTVQAKDFIVFKLTGEICTDYTDASALFVFDGKKKAYSKEIMSLGNLDTSLLAEPVPSTTVVGKVTKAAAVHTGLLEGTPVVIGAGDVSCATVGAGCVKVGQMYYCIGSSAWCATVMDHAHPDYRFCDSILHAVDGLYINKCTVGDAGISYKWLKNLLYGKENSEAYEIMNRLAKASPPGANGVTYTPWIRFGNGSFSNLSVETTQGDIVKATLEGVCKYLAQFGRGFMDIMGTDDVTPGLVGGASKGGIWSEILSDMLGRPILVSGNPEESTSIGAAIIGGVGVGLFKDFDVVETFNKGSRLQMPNEKNHEFYKEWYK